jgi:hypothetical protein
MFYFLSSDYSHRYKEDILRCVAAPIGANVQFRYDKVHISPEALSSLIGTEAVFPSEGIVCSVGSNGVRVLPMVPVRKVLLLSCRSHGTSVSLILRMQEFVSADVNTFTADLHSMTNQSTPRRRAEGENPVGAYCFKTKSLPGGVQTGNTLEIWERTVTALREQNAYEDEPFFWVMLGMESEDSTVDTDSMHSIPAHLNSNQTYRLLIYHFQPRGGQKPNSTMGVTFGSALQSVVPPDTSIDSRYDLKYWTFKTEGNPQTRQETWLRVKTAETWELDLPLSVNPAYKSWIYRSLIAGPMVAAPAILAIFPQQIDFFIKLFLSTLAIIFGVLASLAATFKIEKPKT